MLQSFRLSGTSFVTRPVHIPRNGLKEEQPGRDTHTHIYIYGFRWQKPMGVPFLLSEINQDKQKTTMNLKSNHIFVQQITMTL